MLILTLRTDKPRAEIGLYENVNQLSYKTWEAHRQLAETIHQEIVELLKSQNKHWEDTEGVVVYKGPGSFTGLRIGMSVANALANSLNIPVVAENSSDWQQNGIKRLLKGQSDEQALPEYGADVFTTKPRK